MIRKMMNSNKHKKKRFGSFVPNLKVKGRGFKKVMELDDDEQINEDFVDPDTDIIEYDDDGDDISLSAKKSKSAYQENRATDFYDDSDELDSDAELQEALRTGKLKPGLHSQVAVRPRAAINNEQALAAKLAELKCNFSWIERLDMVSSAEDLPPNIPNPLQKNANQTTEQTWSATNELDIFRNDIKRELVFSQQARASVFKALPKLHKLKVTTRRPADYFAQMLKAETHMNKVQQRKQQQQQAVEKKQAARQLREQKKLGKKIQQEVLLQRQKDKREFNEKVKKMRQGKLSTSELFTDNKQLKRGSSSMQGAGGSNNRFGAGSKQRSRPGHSSGDKKKQKMSKREFKQHKYGLGGRKRDMKKNTAESSASFSEYRVGKHSATAAGRRFKGKGGRIGGSRAKTQNMRARKGNK